MESLQTASSRVRMVPTGLLLMRSSLSFHGSIFTRRRSEAPQSSADLLRIQRRRETRPGMSEHGCPVRADRFGTSFWRLCTPAGTSGVPSCALYGELFRSASLFRSHCFFFVGRALKAEMLERVFVFDEQFIEERVLRIETMAEHNVAQLVRQHRGEARFNRAKRQQAAAHTIVCPMVYDSSVEVVITRQRTSVRCRDCWSLPGCLTRSLEPCPLRLRAMRPMRCRRSITLSSAAVPGALRWIGLKSFEVAVSSLAVPSTRILLSSCSCAECRGCSPKARLRF